MKIASGVTDQYIYFVAVDATDLSTRETGLSSFTVYRSRNGGVAAAMTTPTINETDTTNMPGVYELLLDEDMTIDAGDDTQEMSFHITHAGMAPVTRVIELYRPKITVGNTLDVTATGAAGIDWGNVENPTTAVDLSATDIQLCDTTTTNTDMLTVAGIADGVWDEVLTAATHNVVNSAGRRLRNVQDFGIYDLASVWVDEVAGTSTGTTDGEDATVTNRANDFDNAQTIAASVGLDRIHVQAGNSITLTATLNGYEVWGDLYTIALGGQDVGSTTFSQATISGIGTGTTPMFRNCTVGATTLSPSTFYDSIFTGTLTMGSAGAFRLIDCKSGVAGAGSPTIDMGAAVGATTLELRDWRGGITLSNLAAGDVVTLDGIFGTITLNGADASVEIRGIYKALTNNLTGSPTVTEVGIESTAESECNAALVAIGLDHLVSTSVTGTDIADDSIIAYLSSSSATADWDTFVNTTDSLQAIADSGGGGPTAAQIADAVWDEAVADHTTSTTFGALKTDTAAILVDTGTTLPATLGTPVADLATDIAGVQTDTTAIVADTNELQTDWANGGRLDLILDAAATATALTTVDTNVDSILALLDDARAEPGQGAPPVNPDMATKVDYLYKAWRNKKTQTATTYSLFADNTSTVDQKATVSDDGTTTTIGEIATGP